MKTTSVTEKLNWPYIVASVDSAYAPRRLAFVFKSTSPEWPRWACAIPSGDTKWFWNSDEAVITAADYNAEINGTNRQDEIAKLEIVRR